MILWIKQHKIEALAILLIILFSAFLRFYKLSEYMTFLGDEGRDALMIKRILVEHDFPLLGPPTSVGNIYLGPLYYYMMAIPMFIFWLNPVAAAGMVALIGVMSVLLIYYLSREWFGILPAVVASILYSISPVNIIYSRSSWNPDPAPFFALLSILGFYQARKYNNFLWLILTGGALAAALQMHYLALILLPIFVLIWMYELLSKNYTTGKHYFTVGTIGAVVTFLVLMSPLVIFDLRYNFMNYHAIKALFSGGDSAVSFNLLNGLGSIVPVYSSQLIGRYMAGENILAILLLSILVILPLGFVLRQKLSGQKITWTYFALGVWLVVGLLGLSFYHKQIYDHYLGFLNPVPYLLLGGFVGLLGKKYQFIIVALLLVSLGIINLQKNPLLSPPGNQLLRTQQIAQFIIRQSNNQPFNFALIAKNNYDAAYQFYLDIYGYKPKVVPVEVTDQLFVVCEDNVCNPIGNSKYEISGFGMAKIEKEYNFDGVKIYKLIANPSGKPS